MMKIMAKFNAFVLLFILSIFFISCGYTTKVILPNGIKSIYVPTFKNEISLDGASTYEAGLEVDLTNAVIDRLIYDGNLKVEKETSADAILQGSVIGYHQETIRYNSIEGVNQFRLILTVNLKLINSSTEEIIWEEKNFTADTEYFIEGANAKSEHSALSDLLTDMGKKIVDRIVEDW